MPSQVWVPASARPAFKCEVPGCDAEFRADEESKFLRHVPRCAARHRGNILELSEERADARSRDPLEGAFDEEALDFQRRKYGSG